MFTVKFIKHYILDDENSPSRSGKVKHIEAVSCPRYTVWERSEGFTISTFRDLTDGSPSVSYTMKEDFHECYIENEAGKTIASYRVHMPLDTQQAAIQAAA